jgi:hypothetical protein
MEKQTKPSTEKTENPKELVLEKLPEAKARITPPQIPPLPQHKQGVRVSDIMVLVLILLGLAFCGLSIWGIIAIIKMIINWVSTAMIATILLV